MFQEIYQVSVLLCSALKKGGIFFFDVSALKSQEQNMFGVMFLFSHTSCRKTDTLHMKQKLQQTILNHFIPLQYIQQSAMTLQRTILRYQEAHAEHFLNHLIALQFIFKTRTFSLSCSAAQSAANALSLDLWKRKSLSFSSWSSVLCNSFNSAVQAAASLSFRS